MRSPHVENGHACREHPDEQHDGVPRSPLGQHLRPVEQHNEHDQRRVRGLGLRYPTDDVIRDVKRQQEDREQGRGGQDGVFLHSAYRRGARVLEQPSCDEGRIGPLERRPRGRRRLHLTE
jgi:hypothetical protein